MEIIKDRNIVKYLRTYDKGEKEKIKEVLEKAYKKKKASL